MKIELTLAQFEIVRESIKLVGRTMSLEDVFEDRDPNDVEHVEEVFHVNDWAYEGWKFDQEREEGSGR